MIPEPCTQKEGVYTQDDIVKWYVVSNYRRAHVLQEGDGFVYRVFEMVDHPSGSKVHGRVIYMGRRKTLEGARGRALSYIWR